MRWSKKTFRNLAILILMVVLSEILSTAQAKYGGGKGEPNDPYLIYTAEQMNAIGADSNDWDKHFKLMADIDLSQFDGKDGRQPFNMIGTYYCVDLGCGGVGFTGVFDGNDCTISNLNINGGVGTGLFCHIDGGIIKDLGLVDPCVVGFHSVGALVGQLSRGTINRCYVEGGDVFGYGQVGGLVGSTGHCRVGLGCFEGGEVSDCYVVETVVGGHYGLGGLIGGNILGIITESYSRANVISVESDFGTTSETGGLIGVNMGTVTMSFSSGNVLGNNKVGGLVGVNDRAWSYPGYYRGGIITDCYSTGSVSADVNVGGLLGYNSGCVSNCYSTGVVNGANNVGGLMGFHGKGQTSLVWNCFWDIDTQTHEIIETIGLNEGVSINVSGLPTEEMKMASTFINADWDFITPVWTIEEDVDYPRLWWEFVPVLHTEPEVTLGNSNIISWEPITGNIEYYAECAEDADFSIITHNSGWITETNCVFSGLELGKMYWYSVKARNVASVESQWSNVEFSLQGTLADVVEIILTSESMKNEKMKNALSKKIEIAMKMFQEGTDERSLDKIQNSLDKFESDILSKMDGCAEMGDPDKNDWIRTCEGQNQIYPLVIETIEYIRSIVGCWPYPPFCCSHPDFGC